MVPPPAPVATNPYREGSPNFVLTTPPERTNKLAPRWQWKGPFVVKRVPNPYQVVYEDGSAWRTIHVNHAKPAKLTAADPPAPTPTPEPPRPALGYLPRSLQRSRPRKPPPSPQSATPTSGSPSPPTASISAPPAASPSAGQLLSQPIGIPLPAPQNRDLPLLREPMRIQDPVLGCGALPGLISRPMP